MTRTTQTPGAAQKKAVAKAADDGQAQLDAVLGTQTAAQDDPPPEVGTESESASPSESADTGQENPSKPTNAELLEMVNSLKQQLAQQNTGQQQPVQLGTSTATATKRIPKLTDKGWSSVGG